MFKIRTKETLCAACLLLGAATAGAQTVHSAPSMAGPPWRILPDPVLATAVPPDSTLYTTYSMSNGGGYISWVVCGSTQVSEGCYAAGNLGPFGHAGAILEGDETVVGNRITGSSEVARNIYVVDDGGGNGNVVKLYIYLKTDVVTSTTDTVAVNLAETISLPLQGGAGVHSYIAGNANYLFVGASGSSTAVRVRKSDLSTQLVGGFSPATGVSAITADKYGYVTVTFGNSGFYTFGPDGGSVEDGGGYNFMAGTQSGVTTADLGVGSMDLNNASRLHVRLKTPTQAGVPAH